eukprot:GFYU01013607.1.p1 GENE.GFYU01013607.1~~GFYU01013607.1.p1  ORF type:complete len:145 (-),score=19.81 GFYU01013607.1:360-794(-)
MTSRTAKALRLSPEAESHLKRKDPDICLESTHLPNSCDNLDASVTPTTRHPPKRQKSGNKIGPVENVVAKSDVEADDLVMRDAVDISDDDASQDPESDSEHQREIVDQTWHLPTSSGEICVDDCTELTQIFENAMLMEQLGLSF